MKKKFKPDQKVKTTKPSNALVTWTVRGPNWLWKKRARANFCPVELATLALEEVWSKNPDMQEEIKSKYLISKDNEPILGLAMQVDHSKMTKQSQKILVCSITALANAGYYNEAKELEQLA